MRFALTADQQMVVDAVRALAEGPLAQAAAAIDHHGEVPAAVAKQVRDLGAWGLTVAERVGGLGLDEQVAVACISALAMASAGVAQAVAAHDAAAAVLAGAGHGPLAQRLAAGEAMVCVAVPPDSPRLQARRAADGTWGLQGQVAHVLQAQTADWALICATTDGAEALFVAPLTDGQRQPVSEQLGLRGAAAAHLVFADTAAEQIGDCETVTRLRTVLTLRTAAVAIGVGRGALQAAARYASQREQFGKPIAALQPVQWHVADGVTALDAAELLVQRAAWQAHHSAKGGTAAAHVAKAKACEAAVLVADKAIQVHGGYGYTRDFPVERAYRDAHVVAALQGEVALHKVLAARLLAA